MKVKLSERDAMVLLLVFVVMVDTGKVLLLDSGSLPQLQHHEGNP